MHVFFSGIGGTGIAALALVAKEAGYEVSGSDARDSQYLKYLKDRGISDTYVGISREQITKVHLGKPIDWYVHGSAQLMDFPDNDEFKFVKENGIKQSKRDEFLSQVIKDKDLKLIAVAGTHGKTTVTAMVVWLFKELGLPLSYSVGGKISFGDVGHFDPTALYFVYEADEYDRNFLAFHPYAALITGIDWDHPDIYPSREDYYQGFRQFLDQSQKAAIWQSDVERLGIEPAGNRLVLDEADPGLGQFKLSGEVNRQNAWQVAKALQPIVDQPLEKIIEVMNRFPGLDRRFEEIIPNLYSDYAHTPAKIRGALQMAMEVINQSQPTGLDAGQGAGEQRTEAYKKGTSKEQSQPATLASAKSASGVDGSAGKQAGVTSKLVVVYEGLHNLRQHFIKDELADLFNDADQLYIVPTYLGREDPDQKVLSPADLVNMLSKKDRAQASELNGELKQAIEKHIKDGQLVLCLTAGGPNSLDEWLRQEFTA